jgi:adenine-specific DNA-methyltransferase
VIGCRYSLTGPFLCELPIWKSFSTVFPAKEAVTEGKIDFDVLKQLLGAEVDAGEEKYGLNWHGKRRARQLALTPSIGTLRPCPEDSVDWDTTKNLMIEGDNLEVLKLLQKSYAGKVKLIYTDPPYNTGKDFVYPDNFQDNIKNYLELTGQLEGGRKISSNTEASGRFHTDWLNMMYPRLKLARNVLREDGVIFVSIADHEIHNLRLLMNEIFGEENFIAAVIWQKVFSPKNSARHFSEDHDYIIGAGALVVCLATKIGRSEVEPLALGIVEWQKEFAPAGESTAVFRDSAFADDVAKTNLTAILQQHGLGNVRSL